MDNINVIIRKCSKDDAKLLAEIGAKTFKETFADSNTEEDMNKCIAKDFNEAQILKELSSKASAFYIAQLQENNSIKTVGYMKINFFGAQTEENYKDSLEIQRIYIDKDKKGMKSASKLMQKAITEAKNAKLNYIWLGVWEHNEKAIKFYTAKGFEKFGSHVFVLGDDKQTYFLMKKYL